MKQSQSDVKHNKRIHALSHNADISVSGKGDEHNHSFIWPVMRADNTWLLTGLPPNITATSVSHFHFFSRYPLSFLYLFPFGLSLVICCVPCLCIFSQLAIFIYIYSPYIYIIVVLYALPNSLLSTCSVPHCVVIARHRCVLHCY